MRIIFHPGVCMRHSGSPRPLLTDAYVSMDSEQTDPLQPLPTVFGSWMGNRITPCNLSELIG